MHAFLAALLLGSDGFTVSLALGPLITRTPARRRLALAFGLCDVAATIAGFALHRRIPGGWVAGGAPALALSYGCYVLVVARSAPARLHRWPAYLLPVLLSLDNLAYGSAVPSPGAGVVPHALLLGASSAALAFTGLVAGGALGRRRPGSAERWAAAGLVAASFVLLRA